MTPSLIIIIQEEGFDTKDVNKAFIVIGNKNGVLSGLVFNQTNFQRFKTDISQFKIDYPIFLDTSGTRIIFSDDTPVEFGKRERLEDTISVVPDPKISKPETIDDLQAQWAEMEEQYQKQIETLMERESKAKEHNMELIQECTEREEELQKAVNECSNNKAEYERNIQALQEEVRTMKMEPMEMTIPRGERTFFAEEEAEPTPDKNNPEQAPTMNDPERPKPTKNGSRLNPLFSGFLTHTKKCESM